MRYNLSMVFLIAFISGMSAYSAKKIEIKTLDPDTSVFDCKYDASKIRDFKINEISLNTSLAEIMNLYPSVTVEKYGGPGYGSYGQIELKKFKGWDSMRIILNQSNVVMEIKLSTKIDVSDNAYLFLNRMRTKFGHETLIKKSKWGAEHKWGLYQIINADPDSKVTYESLTITPASLYKWNAKVNESIPFMAVYYSNSEKLSVNITDPGLIKQNLRNTEVNKQNKLGI